MDSALASIESLGEGEHFTYINIAKIHGVSRTTLSRRHRQIQASKEEDAINRQKLHPQQELELVQYITGLTKRGLAPTREMTRRFASEILKEEVGEGWVTRFLHRNQDTLTPHWTPGMDRNRHEADSEYKYKLYFDLLHTKMKEYDILPENTYNMDEKGFMIGNTQRSKRIFSKVMWERKEIKATLQDSSREWVTILACIGADGEALPPAIIFEAAAGNVRSSWVDGIEPGNQGIMITSSPSGWTNNEVGLG